MIDAETGDYLKLPKEPILVEDGVAQIDETHPDYDYWMED